MMEKKRLREMTWEDYGITRHRYEELRAFCLQYEEKKREIARGAAGLRCHTAVSRTGTEDPAKRAALRRRRYQRDLEMIEEAARAACPEIDAYMIKSVTKDLSYPFLEYDLELGRIPMGKTDFYARRKLFYYFLDRLKSGDKIDLLP